MPELEDFEIGLMFWAKEDARQTLREAKQFGVRAGQLGFPGEMPLDGKADDWNEALAAENFQVITAVCSYVGEDYADIPTVQRTVGLVPSRRARERIQRTKAVADVAAQLGIKSVMCHIGFVPHNATDPLYAQILTLPAIYAITVRRRTVLYFGNRPGACIGRSRSPPWRTPGLPISSINAPYSARLAACSSGLDASRPSRRADQQQVPHGSSSFVSVAGTTNGMTWDRHPAPISR